MTRCAADARRMQASARTECTDHFVIFGQPHLRHLLKEFVRHYHAERYHQGINADSSTRGRRRATITPPSAPFEYDRGSALCSTTTIEPQHDSPSEFSDTTGQ